jgi:hypothetical protein
MIVWTDDVGSPWRLGRTYAPSRSAPVSWSVMPLRGIMMNKKPVVVLVGLVLVAALLGCEKLKEVGLEKEMNLVIKAGKGDLSSDEKDDLRKSNHPLLMQLSDPNTNKLITLFANLPSDSQKELLKDGYLKWKFINLDSQKQQVWRDMVQVNLDMAAKQGTPPNPSFSQAALQNASVGFAVVDIPEVRSKVVSWYVLWPELQPTWVTVVGARAAGSQPYFTAHLIQLPALREKADSRSPS